MGDQQTHRYGLWSIGAPPLQPLKTGTLLPAQEKPRPDAAHSAQNKLDDLQTLLLLYSYGLPIDTALDGVCTRPGGQSAKCQTKKISSESVNLIYTPPHSGSAANVKPVQLSAVGMNVALDLAEVGSFKGIVSSHSNDGFQVAVDSDCKTSLGARLAYAAIARGIKHDVEIASGPGVTRIEPHHKDCRFIDHTGSLRSGSIVNLSQLDALIRASMIPPRQSIVVFKGHKPYGAEVTSRLAIGFMVKFCNRIPDNEFSTQIKFFNA